MDHDEYQRMADAGDGHWWYRSTRALLAQTAAHHLGATEADTLYLDAAGGSGATGRWLVEVAPTVLTDLEPMVLGVGARSSSRYLPLVADLNRMPHPDDGFDLSLCVTALCHQLVPDPQHVVDELARVTKPGGLVLLMEPGVRRLRRGHDEVTHTARRFSRSDLRRLITGAGLDVVRSTGAYSFLIPPATALAIIERGNATSDVGRNRSGAGGILPTLARAERAVLRRVDLPVGLSVLALGRKPARSKPAG